MTIYINLGDASEKINVLRQALQSTVYVDHEVQTVESWLNRIESRFTFQFSLRYDKYCIPF